MKKIGLISLLLAAPALAVTPAKGSSLLEQIPQAAILGGAVRPSALELIRTYFNQSADMQKDVGTFLTKRIGVDLTRIDGAAWWSTQIAPQPTFAVFLRLPSNAVPPLKGKSKGAFDGSELVEFGKVVAAAVPGGLVIGDEQEVRVGVAVAHKHAPSVNAQSPLAPLIPQEANDMVAGLAASAVKDAQMQAAAQQFGVKTVTLVFGGDGKIVLEAVGDGARLQNAQNMLQSTVGIMMMQLKTARDTAMSRPENAESDFATDLGAVLGYHQMAAFWKEFQPKLEGDKLVCRYQLPQVKTASMMMPIIGVGAAVAIPAFMKYIRRSKTVEATMNVRKLADSAMMLATEAGQGKKVSPKFAFPKSTNWTPAASCCGQPGDKCAADASQWKGESWKALNFSVDDAHHYQYRVTSTGKGAKASIVVEARGDLDCDGINSTFKRTITLDAQGTPKISPLESANDIE
jgi:type IV pilus assembly protein PilA